MMLFLCSCPELCRTSSAPPSEVATLEETRGGGWESGCSEMLSKRIINCGTEGGGDHVLLREGTERLWFSGVAALVAWGIAVGVDVISEYPGEGKANAQKASGGQRAR